MIKCKKCNDYPCSCGYMYKEQSTFNKLKEKVSRNIKEKLTVNKNTEPNTITQKIKNDCDGSCVGTCTATCHSSCTTTASGSRNSELTRLLFENNKIFIPSSDGSQIIYKDTEE